MTDDRLLSQSPGDSDSLPIHQDPRQSQALSPARPSQALTLELLDDKRDTDPDAIDLLAYWHILLKRRRLIASVLAGMVALALLVTLMTQPLYRAVVLIQVDKEPPPIVQSGSMPFYQSWDPEFLTTQFELLRSRALAERIANELELDAATLNRLQNPGWISRVLGLLRPQANVDQAAALGSIPNDAAVQLKRATGVVQRGLSVQPVENSRLVRLTFDSTDPQFSVRVANAVAEGFIASTLERRMGATSYAKTYLEDQLVQTKAKLEESERNIVEFAQKEGLVNTGAEGTSLATQNLTSLNASMAGAQSERILAASRWRQAAGGALSSDMLAGTNISGMQQQRATLQLQYQENLQKYKPDYPLMQSIKSQIDEVTRQIAAETGRARSAVKAEYDAAVAREGMLKNQIAALRGAALDTDSRSIQYNILKREADTSRQLYDSLLQRFKEVGAASDVRSNNISIIDRAQDGWRFKPNLLKNLAMGLLAGLLLGVLLAFLLEFLDDTLKIPEDIEQKLKLPVLGVIPKLGPKESVEAASGNPQSPFSESYRSVRTALQFATDHGVPRSILVTSPSSSEGKSTTALALARNLAQLGKRVLLLDGDLRNPSLHRTLGLGGEVGLSNLLSGACSFSKAVQESKEERLHVITAGPLPPNPAELLSGSKLVSLLTVGTERYDHVIIDGPPVLGLADALILSNAVEGTLLVATAGKTRISIAQQALKRLLSARARMIGALLTKYDRKTAGYGYQYEGYYAYGGGQPRLGRG